MAGFCAHILFLPHSLAWSCCCIMGDEEGAPYSWTSTEPLLEGVEEAPSGPWVKQSGKGKVVYPNGDTFEGTFNDKLEKHGRGVYTWGTAVGNNPWVPEEGFPGACAAFAHGSRRALLRLDRGGARCPQIFLPQRQANSPFPLLLLIYVFAAHACVLKRPGPKTTGAILFFPCAAYPVVVSATIYLLQRARRPWFHTRACTLRGRSMA